MAKKSSVQNNIKKKVCIASFRSKREALKTVIKDASVSLETRMAATHPLAEVPRNSSSTRFRNRCEVSGRPRGFHKKFQMSRIALRELGSQGLIPGIVKSSW